VVDTAVEEIVRFPKQSQEPGILTPFATATNDVETAPTHPSNKRVAPQQGNASRDEYFAQLLLRLASIGSASIGSNEVKSISESGHVAADSFACAANEALDSLFDEGLSHQMADTIPIAL
jgi:hypothetical protein